MAQLNITQSLFGFTPADVQRQLDQQGFERDLAMAQNPVAGFGAMGLQSLRRGTQTAQRGLFGVEPPEMAEANALERAKQAALPALQSGGQLAYLDALAGELERMGLTNQAVQARMLADQQRAAQGKEVFSQINPKDFTPESVAEFARTQDYSKLIPIEKPTAQQRKAIGKAANSGEQVYQEGDQQFILRNGQKVPYYGSLRKEQGDITVGGKQETKILSNKAAQAGKVEENATAAVNQLANAEAIGGVLDRAFTGVGSDIVLSVGQVANALGVQVSGTTESEQLDQLLAALTAGQARNLPGPLSEKELAFLKQSIGTRGVTRETLRATVNRLQEAAYSDVIANNRLQKYIDEGNDLNKFNFAKNASEAKKLARLLSKATPEQRRQILGE